MVGKEGLFHIGQNSLEVCQAIVGAHPEILSVCLIKHEVGINWRQQHDTPEKQIGAFLSGLGHLRPLEYMTLCRQDFLDARIKSEPEIGIVWSMTSEVVCAIGMKKCVRHIPMMNFHPEGIGIEEIEQALNVICSTWKGVILDSGRHQHYYGNHLLDKDSWVKWMAEFLGPCVLVSPRYIGHRLHHGYASLRLTSDSKYKPVVPIVIKVVGVEPSRIGAGCSS